MGKRHGKIEALSKIKLSECELGQGFDRTSREVMVLRYGDIEFDPNEFSIVSDKTMGGSHSLRYVGKETDGANICLPDGIKSGMFLFKDCKQLETPPEIPDSVTSTNAMFSGCEKLKTAPKIPASTETCIGMFEGCTSLRKAPEIPDGVKYCTNMFNGCTALEEAPELPKSVVNTVGMFEDCRSLKEGVDISENVKSAYAMYHNCSNLSNQVKINNKNIDKQTIYSDICACVADSHKQRDDAGDMISQCVSDSKDSGLTVV